MELQGRDRCQKTRLVELYPQIGGLGGPKREGNPKMKKRPAPAKDAEVLPQRPHAASDLSPAAVVQAPCHLNKALLRGLIKALLRP